MIRNIKKIWNSMTLSEKVNGAIAAAFAMVGLYAWIWIAAIVEELQR